MHYLMMINNKPDMVFRAELLIRSIKYFSNDLPSEFSIVVNKNDKNLWKSGYNLNLTSGNIDNKYISLNADVFECPFHWSVPMPSRWFIKPKMDTCVFIDADIIACKDLAELYNLEKNVLHGVTTHKKHMQEYQWNLIGFNENDLKSYFNFGMLVVPSKYILDIGNKMLDNVLKIMDMFPEHAYFSGQIALAYTLKELAIPLNVLPNKFNWYDLLPENNNKEIIFLHYFMHQNYIKNRKTACLCYANGYMKMISDISRKLYKIKI